MYYENISLLFFLADDDTKRFQFLLIIGQKYIEYTQNVLSSLVEA